MVDPDASSALWRARWSTLKQNCYSTWDLGLALHPREQGLMDDLEASSLSQGIYIYIYIYIYKKFKTEQSPGKVAATFLFDVYGVLLVGFTALLSTINAAAYQETLKRLKETIRQKRPGCRPQEFFFCTTIMGLTVRLQSRISWPHGAGKFFTSTTQPWSAPSGFQLFPKMEKHLKCQHFHSYVNARNEFKR